MPYENKSDVSNTSVRRGAMPPVYGDVVPGIAVSKGELVAVLSAAHDNILTSNKGYEGYLIPASVVDTSAYAAAKTEFLSGMVGVAAHDVAATDRARKLTVWPDAYVEYLTDDTAPLFVGAFVALDDDGTEFADKKWTGTGIDLTTAHAIVVEQAPLSYPYNDLTEGVYPTPQSLGAPIKVEARLLQGFTIREDTTS